VIRSRRRNVPQRRHRRHHQVQQRDVRIQVRHPAMPQRKPGKVAPVCGHVAGNADKIAVHRSQLVGVLDLQQPPADGKIERGQGYERREVEPQVSSPRR
jgi:hypothetical protein